jgi:4-amino-4-deoxy-L-arabinose transferase-like glycosyltransferase
MRPLQNPELRNPSLRELLIICAFIFLLAFGVRLLTWHDTRFEVVKVQNVVAEDYKRVGRLLRQDGLRGFFSPTSALADLDNLGHPPGYSILLALIHSAFGESDSAAQFFQIVADSFAAVLILLIVFEVFSLAPGVIAGVMAAFSPQFAWNSVLLLPACLAVLPILLGVYLLARSRDKPRLVAFLMIGALVGLSCWLRANAMLLTVFLATAVLLLHGKKRWRYSLAVIAGTLLIVLPLTIRNAIATRHFIPVSLGAGQTLLEGIADYDTNGRFGIPNTDMDIMRQEAEVHQRPEYYGTLFNPDGVQRERARIKRGARVIASNPFWFATVMARRAGMMMRLERTPIAQPERTKMLRLIARPFITAVFLPMTLIGLGLSIYRRQTTAVVILSVVPLYYFIVQSVFHTEYRYVLAVNYFLFAFAAMTIVWVVRCGYQKVSSLFYRER